MIEKIHALPWLPLILFAGFMALAPFQPQPHLVEKLQMLRNGTLTRAIDIFDLFWHTWPIALLIAKAIIAWRLGADQAS